MPIMGRLLHCFESDLNRGSSLERSVMAFDLQDKAV